MTRTPATSDPDQARTPVFAGVDTHKELHVAAVIDAGEKLLGTRSFPTTRTGYRAMLAWIGMLVAQPWLVHTRRLAWHRRLGKSSYVMVPVIVVTALLLAQLRISEVPPAMLPLQRTIMYLGFSASIMLLLVWGLGIRHRRDPVVHARYMMGTALLLIDPSLVRVMIHWIPALPPPLYQWISFGIVYAVLGLLLAFDRVPRGRRTLQVVLALMVAWHVSILFVPGTQAWQHFADWYAAL